MSDGGTTALQENEARLREVEGRADKLKSEKEAVSSEIDKLKNDISKQQVSLSNFCLQKYKYDSLEFFFLFQLPIRSPPCELA